MAFGHGKVILFGEHSVVHGRPAMALAVERGVEVDARRKASGPTTLHIEPWNVTVDTSGTEDPRNELLRRALELARAYYPDAVELTLSATLQIPGGAGMGSSAALGVAVLRAMDEARGITRPDEELNQRAFEWECVFHGTPGGVDNTMATYGGIAIFQQGEPLKRVVPRRDLRLLVGDSGVPRQTKTLVASVRRQFEKEPERIGKLFDAIASIVGNARVALEQGDLKSLGQLMTMNQMLLASLMLSHPELETMIAAANQAGALGAKLTGGGGGGCMIALVETDEQHAAVKAALAALGKTVYEVEARVSARDDEGSDR
jgi:mevalonate kinase